MDKINISERKQKMYDDFLKSPLRVGERVGVKDAVFPYGSKGKVVDATIIAINGEEIEVKEGDGSNRNTSKSVISKEQIEVRGDLYYVGANPFLDDDLSIRFVAFNLESVLHGLDLLPGWRKTEYKTKKGVPIQACNWNPYVYDKDGNKQYYQRPFVWTLEENQLLIESIYQRIECGRILVRLRSWAEAEKMEAGECAFKDIVDGKQRLNAVVKFMNNEYPDLHGNYFADLSNRAQHQFTNHQLFAYAEMQENTTDAKVIEQFLKLNFAGVPQSKEHIEFVKNIHSKMN